MSGTGGFTAEWVSGPPTYLTNIDGEETQVVTAGHWEINASGPGITYGTSDEGDGANYLAGLAGITAALPALVDSFFNEVTLDPSIQLSPEQLEKYNAFKAIVRGMGAHLAEIPDNSILDMGNGLTITGAELKSIWARVDFWINPQGTTYLNETARGEANYNWGDPKVSYNIDVLMEYCDSPAEMIYLVLHELGHLTQAGRDYNGMAHRGEVTSTQNEIFANTIALAIATATQQSAYPSATHGYYPTPPSFTGGTASGTGGTTGGTGGGTGGDTGGYTGGGGGGGWQDRGPIP